MVEDPFQEAARDGVITAVKIAMIPAALRAVSESRSSKRAVSGHLPRTIYRFVLHNLTLATLNLVCLGGRGSVTCVSPI
jgi:hypothetical protein